ncbi:ComF family protein [Paraliomyxa miuraensis]|uniref:ComF family protein n=1 Tax=Paraliomyxa miuraensis TaxID=376150 RepID=UPI00224F79D1|nr:phosphoribosyltransferase family protein [Paraliomyxa miuraensis]MCX4243217.1 phosphoribosyltransferase family protein [Paraliomyxa miuraensis]
MADVEHVLLSLLFPPVCLGCGVLLRRGADPHLPLCQRCALEHVGLPSAARAIAGISAVHAYAGPLLRALQRLKFHHQPAWAGPLGSVLASSPAFDLGWDALVPVPLHPARLRQRGYNQSALLARFGRAQRPCPRPPLRPHWLQRARDTAPQHRLPADQRPGNVHEAFRAPHPERVADRRILLVDDVTTTGATLHAARRALLAAGAAEVGALALLRTLA